MGDFSKNNNLKDLYNYLSGIRFQFNFKNLGYLPRWVILMLDTVVVLMAAGTTYLLFKGLTLTYIKDENIVVALSVYVGLNVLFFWIFRTYSGIIRHSSYIDALKLFFAQFSTVFLLIAFNYFHIFFLKRKCFMTTGILMNGILSFSYLFFYRVVVKQTFEKYFNASNKIELTKALILGSDANAIVVANALKLEIPKRFKILGFIDRYNQNSSKRILDLPILQMKKRLPVLMRMSKAQALIIADKSLSKEERKILVEECLEYNFKVYTIPLVSDWDDRNEISKSIKSFEIQDLLERKPIVLDTKTISNQLKGKKVLVSGAAGSIGSEIVRQIIEFSPNEIIIVDQAETPLHELSIEILNVNPKVKIRNIISDIRNKGLLDKVFSDYKPDVVYHAAAYKHVPLMEENPAQAIYTNVMGTKNLADLSYEYGVQKFVMVSTDKAVNPSNVMGASKRIAEKYVQSFDYKLKQQSSEQTTKFITTRFGNVLGSNGSVVPLFTKQIQEGGPITITHPEIIRYFMTIPEACQLVLEAGSMGKGGEIFIFDMGEPVKIIDLANKMIRLAGFIPDKDIMIKVVGLRPGEKLYEELLNDSSKSLATHNEKIMIAEEKFVHFDLVNEEINELILMAKTESNNKIVRKMKKIVPEFKSMNSVFETLDVEINQ